MNVTSLSEVNGDQLNLDHFVSYLKDIPGDWKLFVIKLLPHHSALNVIRDIRRSGGSKTDDMLRIYRVFLNERDPPWTKVHRALKEATRQELLKPAFYLFD